MIYLLFLLFSNCCYAFEPSFEASIVTPEFLNYPNFHDNPIITDEMQEKMEHYLLPLDHPAKPLLDNLFIESRVLESEETFVQAGFTILYSQPATHIKVARHTLFPGYIFKVYLDSETRLKLDKPGWFWLASRCEGARRIRKLIYKKKLKHFAVPDKWLYPLPYYPVTSGAIQQPIIVIETDMNLVSSEECKKAWKEVPTQSILEELYLVLSHGSGSWFLTGNVPYSKSGKFCFVDTEYPKRKIPLHKVAPYLSHEMGKYWKKLTED